MAEIARLRNNSALGARILFDGKTEALVEYRRQYSENNPAKKESRGHYNRQFYLLNKDKLSDSSRRQYNLAKLDRNKACSLEYRRQFDVDNSEKKKPKAVKHHDGIDGRLKVEIRNRNLELDEAKAEYRRQNKEKNAQYKQEYYKRNDAMLARIRRLYYLGKKESFRSYSGYPGTKLSWRTPDIVRDYFDSVASPLNISNIVDWYRISRKQIAQHGGLSLYEKFGSLGAALQFAYPEINWDRSLFGHRGKKSGQRWLKLQIKALLPGSEIIEDFQHPDLNWESDSDRTMELDLWIPEHQVGIEYQGEQHYFNVDCQGPSSGAGAYSERDTLKDNLCEQQGITLVAIPYWWDGSLDCLSATLYQARPDVFPESHGSPIPREMPALPRRRRLLE